MGLRRSALAATGAGIFASACAGHDYKPVGDFPVKVGRPYHIAGKTYVPRVEPDYDVLGYASWYGNESGDKTAYGEKFRPDWITAANKTLPLPTYVEVTALDTGKTILVRINDRGPFRAGRIIDLSRGAAEELGIRRQGYARVRVKRVDPPEKDRKRLRKGKSARQRPDESERALQSLRAQFDAGIRDGLIPPG
ncbi:septal ring lytic transglycosylase RlpA family protein [Stakelama sp. CBK3Z-3]|uniref:Endolytic peptidoglycan transglycosylase RlpA n=1 Tax=Stakelama flava TaxID=2860338 RepID=A0ABS6XN88_9SPHN|nr:septal ring lytic transglycosylase RlpA family protein [Stakelama flava]MBW4331677.1 septal ring lytic transglycosylase RlpA family protein [Stakelama flava]